MVKIVDITRKPVRAAASFTYRGYTISMSTIFNVSTVAFWPRGCVDSSVYTDANSVEDAIKAIDAMEALAIA